MTSLLRVRAVLIALLIAFCSVAGPQTQSAPVVRGEGDHFTIDGNAAFLIFVSYFDALRASSGAWTQDLDWLRASGVSGVRIFGNWHNYCTGATVTDALIGPNGTVNGTRMATLRQFLSAAAQRGLIVDLSFDNEIGTSPITLAQYKAALASVASQLSSHGNVVIDVDNEYPLRRIEGHAVSDTDAATMIQGVKQGDSRRLAAASRNGSVAAGTVTRTAGMDFVAFHDSRDQGVWFTDARATQSMNEIRSGLSPLIRPVYYQEPMPFDSGCRNSNEWDGDLGHADAAIAAAKKAGAAAWTFHTRYGFQLTGTSLFASLPPGHRATIQNLRNIANANSWGASAFTVSPTVVNIAGGGGSASVTATRVANSTGNWRASANVPWIRLNATQGSGSIVGFTVDANPSSQTARSGIIDISGRSVTVNQEPNGTVRIAVDTPQNGATVRPPYVIAGWAIDLAAPSGTGIDAVHVWAYPASGQPATFVGAAAMGGDRPDVAAAFGSRFRFSGFSLTAGGLPAGTYTLAVHARTTSTGTFQPQNVKLVTVTVPPPDVRMNIDAPAPNSTVSSPFLVGGWAIDLASGSGTGIDTIHVWAYPNYGSGQAAVFLGVPALGGNRPDVGAAFGNARFTPSGFNLSVGTLGPGTHLIAVFPHSVVSNAFEPARTVLVTVR